MRRFANLFFLEKQGLPLLQAKMEVLNVCKYTLGGMRKVIRLTAPSTFHIQRYIILEMDKESTKQISIYYEELLGLLHGLGDAGRDSIVNGPVTQYESIVKGLARITQQDLNRFLPMMTDLGSSQWVASGLDLKTSANSLVAWLRATYFDDKPAHYIRSTSPTNQVNVSQEVNVTQSLIVDITGMLTTKQAEFSEGTKERSFIEKVKAGLGSVRDTAAILALITKTASDLGLTASELHKIFSQG